MKKSIIWRVIYIIIFSVPIITVFVFLPDISDSATGDSKKEFLLCVFSIFIFIMYQINQIIFSIKMLRRRAYLIENGKKINIIVDKKYREKRAFVYCQGKWLDRNSNIEYKFKSIEYCADKKVKIPKKVDVYINEENPKIYYMALEESVVANNNKSERKEKSKHKLKLPFGLVINYINKINSKESDIKFLIENGIDFKIEKARNYYLEVLFAYEKCYLLFKKIKKNVYKFVSCDKNQVQKISEEFYKNGKIEDLSNWTCDNIQEHIDTIKKIEYSLENIRIDNNILVLKDIDEDKEKTIDISSITKVIKFSDIELLVDVNLILFTDESRILLAYEEDNLKLNISQIYEEILDKNKKIKGISMEVNLFDLNPDWALFEI